MTSRSPYLILFIVIAVCIAMTGCTSTTQPPPGNVLTTIPVTGSQPDLTNQNSQIKATFRNGNSFTPLVAPQPLISLERMVGGLTSPMMIALPGDGIGRMFVVEQTGTVRIISANKTLLDVPFLDLRDRMVNLNTGYDERGLLSIAFHHDYKINGRMFVYYSAPLRSGAPSGWSCTNRLSEFRVMADNPERVDMSTEKVLLMVDKPSQNHNGGTILFGPDDGYLYLALGDGGGAGDTGTGHTPGTGNAQDSAKILGKIIRIDVDSPGVGGRMYAIPGDNPFETTANFLPEIYAMGLRNPAYMSFDSGDNHHLITAVAGQALFESVFVVARGGNYGWNIREGTHCYNPANPSSPPNGPCLTTGARGEPLIGPIIELGHDLGSTVVGGYIYRGTAIPSLNGKYIFGDWSAGGAGGDGTILVSTPPRGYDIGMYPVLAGSITPGDNLMWSTQEFRIANSANGRVNAFVRGFAEDENHEIYLLTNHRTGPDPASTTGEIWKLVPST